MYDTDEHRRDLRQTEKWPINIPTEGLGELFMKKFYEHTGKKLGYPHG